MASKVTSELTITSNVKEISKDFKNLDKIFDKISKSLDDFNKKIGSKGYSYTLNTLAQMNTLLDTQLKKRQALNEKNTIKLAQTKADINLIKTQIALEKEKNNVIQNQFKPIDDAYKARRKGLDFSGFTSFSRFFSFDKNLANITLPFNKIFDEKFEHQQVGRNRAAKMLEDVNTKLQQKNLTSKQREGLERKKRIYTNLKEGREEKLSSISLKQGIFNTLISGLTSFKNIAFNTFKLLGVDFTNIWKDVAGEIQKILNFNTGAATYSLGTSLIANESARRQAMKYGLSDSQNYAFSQTRDLLNLKDEDLMYMNENQRSKFTELMDKYSNWYDQMQSSGVLQNIQEAQLDFKILKQEMAMKFLNWFSENKGAILALMQGMFSVLQFIMDAVAGLLKLFGQDISTRSANVSDELSSTNNQSNRYINVNVNNTNNASTGISSGTELVSALNAGSQDMIKAIGLAINAE